jgi:hypothetical protein
MSSGASAYVVFMLAFAVIALMRLMWQTRK